MGFFLILIIVLVFFYSLHEMSLVDKFINNIGVQDTKKKILIYGDNELANSIEEICEDENAQYEVMENDIEKIVDKEYNLLILLRNDDLDNLMLCSLGRRLSNIRGIISVCNDKKNKILYEKYKVDCFESNYADSMEFRFKMKERIKHA